MASVYKCLQHCYTSRCNSDPVRLDDDRKPYLGQAPLKIERLMLHRPVLKFLRSQAVK